MTNPFIDKLASLVNLQPSEISDLNILMADPREYSAKQHLNREGNGPGPIIVILEGWGCRYKIPPNGARRIIAFLLPGEVCGLHVGVPRGMDHGVQAITDARVALIPGVEMDALMNASPRIAMAMYKAHVADECTLRSWVISLGGSSARERIAQLVCNLHSRSVQTHDGKLALHVSRNCVTGKLGEGHGGLKPGGL